MIEGKPRPPHAIGKFFDNAEEAQAEMEMLLNPEERTETETGVSQGYFNPSLSLATASFGGKLVFMISTMDIEVVAEAVAHGWQTFKFPY